MLHVPSLGVCRICCRRLSFRQKPPRKSKVHKPCEAVSTVLDGSTVLVGGFGLCGSPEVLLHHLDNQQKSRLTIVCGDVGNDSGSLGKLLRNHRVKCIVTANARNSELALEQYERGKLELHLVPQGTLSERLRAAAAGIPAFYSPVGAGTTLEEGGDVTFHGDTAALSVGREAADFGGRRYVLETALRGDIALVRGCVADTNGNLCFRGTTRGFNETMCGAAPTTVAEVEEVVLPGGLPPEAVHVAGPLVQKVVRAAATGRLESLMLTPDCEQEKESMLPDAPASRALSMILRRVVWEMGDCSSLYLGPGCPSQLLRLIVPDPAVRILTSSGAVGIGPFPSKREQASPDLVDGSKRTATALEGACFVSSHQSASMLRAGHIDLVVINAVQISQYGDISCDPGDAMCGTMDAAAAHDAGSRVLCMMGHVWPDGMPRLVNSLSLPLTAKRCVDLVVTDKAVFEVDAEKGMHLIEIAEGVQVEELIELTGVEFTVTGSLIPIRQFVFDQNSG